MDFNKFLNRGKVSDRSLHPFNLVLRDPLRSPLFKIAWGSHRCRPQQIAKRNNSNNPQKSGKSMNLRVLALLSPKKRKALSSVGKELRSADKTRRRADASAMKRDRER
jgi:hypothetical protein